MERCAVIGASSGTGLAIVRRLEQDGVRVRAISRHPPAESAYVEPFEADVTDPSALSRALEGDFDAVFYTVDIHGLFNSREQVRAVMYDGFVNTIRAARARGTPRIVLLSVIGSERGSWVWSLLGAVKRGMKRNVIDRERAVADSGLPYVICRAPKLDDKPGGTTTTAATSPQHRLDMKMGISRADLATALIRAADAAPENSVWDVFADERGPVPDWLRPTA